MARAGQRFLVSLWFRTQRHPGAPTSTTVRWKSAKWLFWVTLGDPGCGMWRIENPRVGGSIPPLATIQIKAMVENETDVPRPVFIGRPNIFADTLQLLKVLDGREGIIK